MLRVAPNIEIPDDELQFTFVRSAGPGGQNVNKVNTKAVLRWAVTTSPSLSEAVRARFLAHYGSRLTNDGELIINSQQYRDQSRNRADCLERLRVMLATVAVAPKRRRKTRPSRSSVERRLEGKQKRSERKQQRRGVEE
jgi:ribosome-associated protein